MKIAITTPLGHIGKVVTDHLLIADVDVTLLVRHAERVQNFADRGATIREGSIEDESFVVESTRDMEAMLWVTPPFYHSHDLRGSQNIVGRNAREAIRANRISRVVNVSSAGAHLGKGTGPINGLHDVEKLLDEAATNIVHLRAGFFFENYLAHLGSICKSGCVYLPVSGLKHYPMIATKDIAWVAADRLLDRSWSGRIIRGLHGPVDLSFGEAALALSEGLGRSIQHRKVETATARENMIACGLSDNAADLMLELYEGIESGWLYPDEPRTPETTTPTTLLEFAREVLLPQIAEPVAH